MEKLKKPEEELHPAGRDLQLLIEQLQSEHIAAAALQASRGLGVRRYGAGQWRSIHCQHSWQEHCLRVDEGPQASLALHPWTHAPRELPKSAFEEMRAWHIASLRMQHSHIVDALTGKRLDVLKQSVTIDVASKPKLASVTDAHTLTPWLRTLHEERLVGGQTERPTAVQLTAEPAGGNTTLASQVALSLEGELVSIVVKVQQLQRYLVDLHDMVAAAWNWVDAFLCLQHQDDVKYYRFLRQAMMMRRALLEGACCVLPALRGMSLNSQGCWSIPTPGEGAL